MKHSAEDHIGIVSVTHDYAWALDSKDFAMLDDVFTADATADLRSAVPLEGRDALKARIARALEPMDKTQHLVANHRITVDGDTATCRCYLQAQHTRYGHPGGENFILAGWYEDTLVRTPDGWRISFRRLVTTWQEGNIAVAKP
jgi:ketosteroid isomerase-like protein